MTKMKILLVFWINNMDKLKTRMEEIAGSWDGDQSGIQEDNASIAVEVLEKIKEIEELLEGLN